MRRWISGRARRRGCVPGDEKARRETTVLRKRVKSLGRSTRKRRRRFWNQAFEFGRFERFLLSQLYYVSSLKREDARRYSRRQSSRLMSTTTVAMISVDPSSTSKRPESLALLMVLPSPAVET